MKKLFFLPALAVLIVTAAPAVVIAHSGRTDANGGHNCRVGACAGTYHYHNGGGAVAPSTPQPTPAPAPVQKPRVPVVKITQVTREVVTNGKSIIEYDYREYSDYTVKKQAGKLGKRKVTTDITYTDGKETSRVDSKLEDTLKPVNEIVIKGGRTRSVAQIYGVAPAKKKFFGSNKDKYNIWGKFEANREVYLTIDGKKTKVVQTNSEGWFVVEDVKILVAEAWVLVYAKGDSRDDSVSEKTKVYTQSKKVVTEYDLIHSKR